MAAQTAGRLSAPHSFRSEEKAAVDAEPDKGLVTARGIISPGIPNKDSNGEAASARRRSAPLARNIERAQIKAQRVGISENAVRAPSDAPLRKTSKELFPDAMRSPATTRSAGTTRDDSVSIRYILPDL